MIRRRTLRDDRAIFQLVREELLPQARKSFPDKIIKRSAILRRLRKGTTFVSISSRGALEGFITVWIKEQELIIDMLAVTKAQQRKGIGAKLLARGEKYGVLHGCASSLLYVDEHNENGKRFYDRHGYNVTQYVPEVHCFLLHKHISSDLPR